MVVLRVDAGEPRNAAYLRVGRALDEDGVVRGGWTPWAQVPGWRFAANADAGIALADLTGDGRPDLVVFAIEVRAGKHRGHYRVGRRLDERGAVTGGWSRWRAIPGSFPAAKHGGDIALADLTGDGRRELVVVMAGHYRVGRKLDAGGAATGGWDAWKPIPDWPSASSEGVGAAVADLDGDGGPELVVLETGPSRARHTVGWRLDATGRAADGWGPWTALAGWRFRRNRGAAAAFAQLRDGRPQLVTVAGRGQYRAAPLALDVDEAATKGVWRLLDFDSQILAVHAALLHTGDVLFFAGSGYNVHNFEAHRFRTRVWHYPRASFSAPRTPIDLFCCGHAFLPTGRLLAAGGTSKYLPFRGIRDALAFDPEGRRWVRARRMAHPRWYPSLLALGDGRVVAASGRGADGELERVPEVFEPGRGWRRLPSPGQLPWYPHLFLLGDGRVFYTGGHMGNAAGARPSIWEPATGDTTVVSGLPERDMRNQATSVLLPPAQDQRVMIVGGGGADMHDHDHGHREPQVATASVAVADLSGAAPRYAAAASLHQARMHLCAVVLPDRTIMVTGGAGVEEHRVEAALTAEIFDPRAGSWALAARSRVRRLYHSVALLTPDGKVVTAGSNPKQTDEELRIEVFSPPYLFRGARPELTLSADHAAYGGTLAATAPSPDRLRDLNLVRPGATTHASNSEQRLLDLEFAITGPDAVELRLPANPNLAPPGWYMVFAVDTDGVPSLGRWLRLSA